MIQGAIFDMDGTLLDSMSAWEEIGIRYLRRKQITPPPDLTEVLRAKSLLETAVYLRETLGIPESNQAIMEEINGMVETEYRDALPLKPHALAFLQRLAAQGVRCCIATATDSYLAEAALTRLHIRSFFEFIITCAQVGQGKQNPAIFNQALEQLGTPKAHTVVFEDAYYAAKTAADAGFRVIVMEDASAAGQRDDLRQVGERYLEDFSQWEDIE